MDSVPQDCIVNNYAITPEVESAIVRLGELRTRERDTVVSCRFDAGEIFNALRFDSGPRADQLMDRYGEEEYKFFRHCAWVAHKWPKKTRTPGKSWRYYRDNIPGQQPRTPAIPHFHVSASGPHGALYSVTGTNSRGKSVAVEGTSEEMRLLATRMLEYLSPH